MDGKIKKMETEAHEEMERRKWNHLNEMKEMEMQERRMDEEMEKMNWNHLNEMKKIAEVTAMEMKEIEATAMEMKEMDHAVASNVAMAESSGA